MVNTAEQTATNAENDHHNDPGMCLQVCRQWAGIGSCWPDASTAWREALDKHAGDRSDIPRGAPVYWTGGSQGHGHIAISVGGGQVRSTDANGSGNVATRPLSWFDTNWSSLDFAGWAEDINGVHIPGTEDDMALSDADIEKIAKRVNQVLGDYNADGTVRDGFGGKNEPEPEQADKRLRQIEKRQ
jgi:hypothetical protein